MALEIPKTTMQWNVRGKEGTNSLEYTRQPIPELGDHEVLVKIQGASLNYRDILIAKRATFFPTKDDVIPGSDGAGTVLAVGKRATRFKPGDKVVTIINPGYLDGDMTYEALSTGLGGPVDGTFRQIGAFDERGLVLMPEGLSFIEAATLSCAGLTAWNALFGLDGRRLSTGQWVLTQGTGGVSIFAIQLAKMVGAKVIATTSSSEKARLLERLGADHIINYRDTPEWGAVAKTLTGGKGVDMVLEVGGPRTMNESIESLKLDGIINVVGIVGGTDAQAPGLLDCLTKLFTTRGIWVGSRLQMEQLCRAIESDLHTLRPVVDARVFALGELKDAYTYLENGEHQGKVGIEIM